MARPDDGDDANDDADESANECAADNGHALERWRGWTFTAMQDPTAPPANVARLRADRPAAAAAASAASSLNVNLELSWQDRFARSSAKRASSKLMTKAQQQALVELVSAREARLDERFKSVTASLSS